MKSNFFASLPVMVRAKVECIILVGGVEGGVKIPASADWVLFENFLLRVLRGLSGGDLGNILSKAGFMGVKGALESAIFACPFIGGVNGGETGRSYRSKNEMSWRTSRTLDSTGESVSAIVALCRAIVIGSRLGSRG